MKQSMRKSIALALSLVLLLSLVPPASAAEVASGSCGDNLTWSLDNSGTLTISGSGDMIDSINMNDYGWTDYNYEKRPWIERLVLPEGMTSIGSRAFESTFHLTGELVIPEGVTRIGQSAFSGSGIYAVSIPASIQKIGNSAFYNREKTLYHVYYAGSEAQWKQIDIGESNQALERAEIHFAVDSGSPSTPTPEPTPSPSPAPEAKAITVTVNGSKVAFDVPPQIINGRTMVPLRAIFEALGAQVEWDQATQGIHSVKGGTQVSMQIGSAEMTVTRDGRTEKKTLDVPPRMVNSRTLVPVRAIAEAFGSEVEWEQTTRTVTVVDKAPAQAASGEVLRGNVHEYANACFYNDLLYYSFLKDNNIYVTDLEDTKAYAAGGIPAALVGYDNKIYYINDTNHTLCAIDLSTGKRDILFNKEIPSAYDIYDGKIYIKTKSEDISYYNGVWDQIYVLDPAGGTSRLLYTVPEETGRMSLCSFYYADGGLIYMEMEKISEEGRRAVKATRVDLNTGSAREAFSVSYDDYKYAMWLDGAYMVDGTLYIATSGNMYQGADLSYHWCKGSTSGGGVEEITEQAYQKVFYDDLMARGREDEAQWEYRDYDDEDGRTSRFFRVNRLTGDEETIFRSNKFSYFITSSDGVVVVCDSRHREGVSSAGNPKHYQDSTLYVMLGDGSSVVAVASYKQGSNTINTLKGGALDESGSSGGDGGGGTGGSTTGTHTCETCKGSGMVRCTVCGGSGRNPGPPIMNAGGTVVLGCVTCGGTGQYVCPDCGGSGKR